jgi:hypothetical protein
MRGNLGMYIPVRISYSCDSELRHGVLSYDGEAQSHSR